MDRKLDVDFGRREDILAAAKEVFSRYGYAQATVEEIAAKASMAKGSIYNYFRDKEDLFCQVMEALVADDVTSALSLLPPVSAAIQRLDFMLEVFFRRMSTACESGGLIFELWASAWNPQSKLNKPLTAIQQRCRDIIMRILEEGRDRGEFNPSIDTEAATSLIMATLNGTIVNYRFGGKDDFSRLDKMRHGLLLAVSAW